MSKVEMKTYKVVKYFDDYPESVPKGGLNLTLIKAKEMANNLNEKIKYSPYTEYLVRQEGQR